MLSNFFGRAAVRNAKRAHCPPTGRYYRKLHVESLETRRLLTTLTGFALSGYPASTIAGASHSFTLTALQASGTYANYQGTVHFSSTDRNATLPADYTFATSNSGTHSFSATFKTVNTEAPYTQTLIATDTATGMFQTFSVIVTPAGLKTFVVQGVPTSSFVAGVPGTMTATAQDAYGNTVTNYTGTVHYTSSDPYALLPANYQFQTSDAGSHTFTVTFISTGSSKTVTVTVRK